MGGLKPQQNRIDRIPNNVHPRHIADWRQMDIAGLGVGIANNDNFIFKIDIVDFIPVIHQFKEVSSRIIGEGVPGNEKKTNTISVKILSVGRNFNFFFRV